MDEAVHRFTITTFYKSGNFHDEQYVGSWQIAQRKKAVKERNKGVDFVVIYKRG